MSLDEVDDLDRLIRVASRYGFKVTWHVPSGWHTLMHGDVEINDDRAINEVQAHLATVDQGYLELFSELVRLAVEGKDQETHG